MEPREGHREKVGVQAQREVMSWHAERMHDLTFQIWTMPSKSVVFVLRV